MHGVEGPGVGDVEDSRADDPADDAGKGDGVRVGTTHTGEYQTNAERAARDHPEQREDAVPRDVKGTERKDGIEGEVDQFGDTLSPRVRRSVHCRHSARASDVM